MFNKDLASGPVAEPLEARLLMSGTDLAVGIAGGSGGAVSYADADGTQVTVTLKGGMGELSFTGENLQQTWGKRGVTVFGWNVELAGVELFGTTDRSTLAVKTKGGMVEGTTVRDVTVHGPLKSLTGKGLDLLGSVAVEGSLGKLAVDDVFDSEIRIGRSLSPKAAATLQFDQVAGASIESEMPIKSLTATEWVEGAGGWGMLSAPWLGKLKTKGRKGSFKKGILPLAGDFEADLWLTGTDAKGSSLKSAKVAGGIRGMWDVLGSVGSVKAGSTDEAWMLNAQGYVKGIATAGPLAGNLWSDVGFGKIAAKGDLSAAIAAHPESAQDAKGVSIQSLQAGRVGETWVEVSGGIKTIKVAEWTLGYVSADWVGSLTVTGAKGNPKKGVWPCAGDFGADLQLDNRAVQGYALKAAKIAGSVHGMWEIAGNVGKVQAGSTSADWMLNAGGYVSSLSTSGNLNGTAWSDLWIGKVAAKGWLMADIQWAAPFVDLVPAIGAKLKMPASAVSGDGTKITLPIEIGNRGNVALPKGQQVSVVVYARPEDASPDNPAVRIATLANQKVSGLAPCKVKKLKAKVTLPAGLRDGLYTLVVRADALDEVDETYETNNLVSTDRQMAVARGCADLTATLGESTLPWGFAVGEPLKGAVEVLVTNGGTVAVPPGQHVEVELQLRRDSDGLKTALGTKTVSLGGLTPGGSRTVRLSVKADGGWAVGEHHVLATVRPVEPLGELDTLNNIAWRDAYGQTLGIRSVPQGNPGSSPATALNLGEFDGMVTLEGRAGDMDEEHYCTFRVSKYSDVAVTLVSPVCDAELELLDGWGGRVATSVRGGDLIDSLAAKVPAGTYYVRVSALQGDAVYGLTVQTAPSSPAHLASPGRTGPAAAAGSSQGGEPARISLGNPLLGDYDPAAIDRGLNALEAPRQRAEKVMDRFLEHALVFWHGDLSSLVTDVVWGYRELGTAFQECINAFSDRSDEARGQDILKEIDTSDDGWSLKKFWQGLTMELPYHEQKLRGLDEPDPDPEAEAESDQIYSDFALDEPPAEGEAHVVEDWGPEETFDATPVDPALAEQMAQEGLALANWIYSQIPLIGPDNGVSIARGILNKAYAFADKWGIDLKAAGVPDQAEMDEVFRAVAEASEEVAKAASNPKPRRRGGTTSSRASQPSRNDWPPEEAEKNVKAWYDPGDKDGFVNVRVNGEYDRMSFKEAGELGYVERGTTKDDLRWYSEAKGDWVDH